MTKSTITRERLAELVAFKPLPGTDINSATRDEWMAMAAELQARRKAAMGSEPVFNLLVSQAGYKGQKQGNNFGFTTLDAARELKEGRYLLYRHAQPAPEREQVRREHAEWSLSTFGNVGPVGPLKHLSKEALEAAAAPDDLSEWADMHFLLWDAQRRAGITDEQITQAMIEKLAVNKQRSWPEPKEGEPRLHIKEQPAPVVPEGLNPETTDLVLRFASALADKLYKAEQKYGRSTDWMKDDWYDDCLQSLWEHIEKGDPRDVAAYCAFMWYHGWVTTDYDRNVQNACRAAMLQAGNSPVIPGWIPVSERMPEREYVLAADFSGKHYSPCQPNTQVGIYADWFDDGNPTWDDGDGNDLHLKRVTHWMPLPAAPQGVPDGK